MESSYYNLRNQEQIKNQLNIHEPTSFIAEPLSFNDAINCMHADKCKQTMSEEVDTLHKNNTCILLSKPEGANIISDLWAYKIKHYDRFKARLVINGPRQKYGIDYTETFSSVIRY